MQSVPIFRMPRSILQESREVEEGAGGSAWLGCTELSLGLLAFPICKAHNFIFPLKVSLLIPLTHSIEKIHFGGVKACVSLEPLRELALGSMLQGGEEMRIQRPSPVLYLCLSPASKICPCTKSQKTVFIVGVSNP